MSSAVLFRCDSRKRKLLAVAVNLDSSKGVKVVCDHSAGDKSFKLALDISLKGTCAVNGVIALLSDKFLSFVSDFKLKLLVLQTLSQTVQHKVDDRIYLLLGKGLVEYYLVQTVQELGTEVSFQKLINLSSCLGSYLVVLVNTFKDILGAKVGGQYDYGVLEIYRSALRVGDTAVIKYLEQNVEYIGVSLLDLIEEDYGGLRRTASVS